MKTSTTLNKSADFSIPYLEPILIGVFALFYYYIRSNFFEVPMERDEGIYTYYGQLALEGKTPYIDFYESRLPGIFYMYGLLVAIFGDFRGLAIAITLLNIGSFTFLYLFSKSWFNGSKCFAFVAGCTALLLGLAPEISGFTRQSEHIVVFWAMGGLYLLQRAFDSNKWVSLFFAGVFMCLAMLTKPNGIFFILLGGFATVAYYSFYSREEPKKVGELIKTVLIKGLIYSAGVFATFGLMCAYMWSQGALSQMWYWSVTFSSQYATRIPWTGTNGQMGGKDYFLSSFNNITNNYFYFWILAAIGLIAFMFIKNEKDAVYKKVTIWIIAFFSFLTITPSLSFYGHYWLMLIPALALCFTTVFYAIYSIFNKQNVVYIALTIFAAGLLVFNINKLSKYYFKPDIKKVVMQTYGGNPFNETYEIGKYLKTKAKPNDQLILIGSEPQLLIYTGMKSATRHAYFSYLMQDTTVINVPEWQKEFEKDITDKKARFLVFFNHQISIFAQPKANFNWLNNLLSNIIPALYKPIGFVDMLGTATPKYIFSEAELATYRPTQLPNQQIFTATIYELK